jgi:hypothetical protein
VWNVYWTEGASKEMQNQRNRLIKTHTMELHPAPAAKSEFIPKNFTCSSLVRRKQYYTKAET